jgi:hypothetical protein
VETTFDYLRQFGPLLAERILETYPPLQSTKDPVSPFLGMLLRQALPAQALAITGPAKYLRQANAARIVAKCGAGKTYMALGTIHVLAEGRPPDHSEQELRQFVADPHEIKLRCCAVLNSHVTKSAITRLS